MTVRVQRLFGESCLPITMKEAHRLRRQVSARIAAIHPSWPFEDRVMVWLLPTLEDDAAAFHFSGGRGLENILTPHQLDQIDKTLIGELAERMRATR